MAERRGTLKIWETRIHLQFLPCFADFNSIRIPSLLHYLATTPHYALHPITTAMPSETRLPELKVLRSKDAALEDENDWPQFDVRDVEVRDAKGELTSLFDAAPDHPVTLSGTLVTKSENARGESPVTMSSRSLL
jgi:hypothetical protein